MATCTWCKKVGPGKIDKILHVECAIAALQSQGRKVKIVDKDTGDLIEDIPDRNNYA